MTKPSETDRSATSKNNNTGEHTNPLQPRTVEPKPKQIGWLQPEAENLGSGYTALICGQAS